MVILAISCCLVVEKLGAEHISCPMFTVFIQDLVEELLSVSHDLVSMVILHSLAFEAGFEQEFLAHFGSKVLHNKTNQGIEFWIGLVQKKLSVAFHWESVISSMKAFHSTKVSLIIFEQFLVSVVETLKIIISHLFENRHYSQ